MRRNGGGRVILFVAAAALSPICAVASVTLPAVNLNAQKGYDGQGLAPDAVIEALHRLHGSWWAETHRGDYATTFVLRMGNDGRGTFVVRELYEGKPVIGPTTWEIKTDGSFLWQRLVEANGNPITSDRPWLEGEFAFGPTSDVLLLRLTRGHVYTLKKR